MNVTGQENTLGPKETAWLVIGDQVYNLSHKVNKLGRSLENDVVIQDPRVSRVHAEIQYEDGKFILHDLNSSGGTYINKQKIEESVLRVGDIITLANVPLVFVGSDHNLKVSSEDATGKLDESQVI
jgi:pSer/pThr/pTyr-binding forkhead associated (FHA) protein